MKKIPTTIITGFLGAGKTTLVRHLLEHSNNQRLALIINEFGELGIDGELLQTCNEKNCHGQSIIELTNGCICCTVAEEFTPAIETILNQNPQPDHIVIETSGLALPQPLVRAFNWPEIKSQVTVDGVVVVVDGPALSNGQFASDLKAIKQQRANDEELNHETPLAELFEDQLACGDLIILNKTDQLTSDTTTQLIQQLDHATREGVRVLKTTMGAIEPTVLLGLDMASENDLLVRQEIHHTHHDESVHQAHDHDEFESWVVELPSFTHLEHLKQVIKNAIVDFKILRVKGFSAINGIPRQLVLQAVGPRIDCYYDRPFRPDEKFSTKLVFISEAGVDKIKLSRQLNESATQCTL